MAEITRAGAVEAMGAAAIVHSSLPNSMAAALDALLAYLKANGWTPPMPKEADVWMKIAAGGVLLKARESPKGMIHPWRPFDVASVAVEAFSEAVAAAPNPLAEETRDAG